MSNLKNSYLMHRIKHPIETYNIFVPMITFFLPLDQFLIWGGVACLLIVINIKDFISVIRYKKNYLLYIFCIYMSVLPYLYHNTLGLIAAFLLWLVTIYTTYLRTKLTKITFEWLIVICGLGSMLSLYYTTINFYTTSTYKLYEFFMQYIHIPYEFIIGIAENVRSASTFVHANYYGLISAFIALISVFYILDSIRRFRSNWVHYGLKVLFYTLVLAVNLIAIDLTQSRSTYFGLIIGLAFLLASFDIYMFLVFIIPFIGIVAYQYESILEYMPRMDSFNSAANVRFEMYRIAFMEIKQSPFFGKGMYTMSLLIEKYKIYYAPHAHNLILEILLSSGLLGLILLGGHFILIITKPIIIWINAEHDYMPLVIGVIALFIANGFTDATFVFPQIFILIYLIAFSSEINHEKS